MIKKNKKKTLIKRTDKTTIEIENEFNIGKDEKLEKWKKLWYLFET
jgi:hypothetical protein